MTVRHDNATITAYERVQTALESLRITTRALIDQAVTLAACQEFQSEGQDEFGLPNNSTNNLLANLKRDIIQRIHQTKESVHANLYGEET